MSEVRHTLSVVPMVYRRSGSRSFHKVEDCPQLRKGPARGTQKPLETVDLDQIHHPRPCRTCYTDAPRIKVGRRYCPLCNKNGRPHPCEHNGGVKVTIAQPVTYISLLRDPGDEDVRAIWVWPDRAHHYEPLAG